MTDEPKAGNAAPQPEETVLVNPYLNPQAPREPQLCGFGQTFLMSLSAMVNQYRIMPQDMIDKLTPPPEERAAMLRSQAADLMAAAEELERGDPDRPQWGSKWKN